MDTPSSEDAADLAAEIDHVQSLIQVHTRHLRKLELRAATFGQEAPVSLEIQIEDLRAQIRGLLERLDILQGRLPRPVILILDPNPAMPLVLERVLVRLLGDTHEIVTVAGIADVVSWVARRRVPLIVTEYQIGEATVEDLVRAVRAVSPRTEVLLQTAGMGLSVYGPELEFHVRARGVDHVLVKPYAMDWLRIVVTQALERAGR